VAHHLHNSLRVEHLTVQILPERRLRSKAPSVTLNTQETGVVQTTVLKMKKKMRLDCAVELCLMVVFLASLVGRIFCMRLEMRHARKEGLGITGKKRGRISPMPVERLPKLQKKDTAREPPDMQFVLPTRKVADNFMSIYWDYVDSAYPWLDKSSIENAYETLWIKDGKLPMNERALHCILNIIFAMSCVVSQSQTPLSRYQSSVTFFERAQGLMSYDLMEVYNFEIIQILLLTAVYLQHDKMPQKSFRSISMAIHVAQDLGLHLPTTIESINDLRERDLACRVWNGCIVMDR
jgi:hypothetical protein